MRLAVFSDVHGNALWLDAVLKKIRTAQVERLYFLGDSVSYFPDSFAVIRRLQEVGAICVEGNHDNMLRGEFPIPEKNDAAYRLKPVLQTIPPDLLEFVRDWPVTRTEKIDNVRIQFVHGNPLDPLKGYSYEDSPLSEFDSSKLDVVFVGHTHRPWVRQNPHTLMVNVGSVGLPRDVGCAPSWVLFDTKTRDVRVNRLRMSPAELLKTYPDVHESVRECLKRGGL